MAAKITRAATIRGLEMTGWKTAPATTKKYIVFHRDGDALRYLVGKSGALRVMRDHHDSVATSVSLTGNLWHAAISQLGSGGYRPDDIVDACDALERIYDSMKRK